jgi:hypothetical protein
MTKAAAAIGLLVLSATCASGAVIRGTVVEKRTNYSLSRATITLQPIPAGGQEIRSTRSNEAGNFEFSNLPAGTYLLKATRRGFMPMEYGQRRWNSAGVAFALGGDTVMSVHLPLSRYGAITGVVRDQNEVGIPDQDIGAYTIAQPPKFVARARSDELGVYRVGGLEPGSYLIRTMGNNDDDRSYIPTFSRQTLRVEEARPLVVYADEETTDGDVRPIAGRLYELSGSLSVPTPQNFTMSVTLASDMGRTVSNGQTFRFAALPPGRYEIYAEAVEMPPGNRTFGGYSELTIDRDQSRFALLMTEVRETQFSLEGTGASTTTTAYARRRDLAGTGPIQQFMLGSLSRVLLFPGHWEIMATPPDGYYVSQFSGTRNNNTRPEGWNDTLITGYLKRISVTLSHGPGSIHGVVQSAGKPATAAPVFVETWDPVTRQRLLGPRETRTDASGRYRFDGLPPGDYRVLSTFDYASPPVQEFDVRESRPLRIEAVMDAQLDLELSGEPQ